MHIGGDVGIGAQRVGRAHNRLEPVEKSRIKRRHVDAHPVASDGAIGSRGAAARDSRSLIASPSP